MNPAARQVALLNAQAAAWETQSARSPGPGRRHHRRHPGRRPPAAGGRAAAAAGGCCCRLWIPRMDEATWDAAGRLPSASRPAPPAGRARRDARRRCGPGRCSRHRRCPPERFATLSRALLPARPCTPGAPTRRHRWRTSPASALPTSRRKPPPSPWCCATPWKRRAPAPRWSPRTGSWPAASPPNCCATAWWPTTAPANPWPRRRPPCSCAC